MMTIIIKIVMRVERPFLRELLKNAARGTRFRRKIKDLR